MEDKMFDKNEVRNSGISHGSDLKKYEEKDPLEFISPNMIEISEDQEKANEFDVATTPTVLVEKDGEIHKEFGIVSYFSGDLGKGNKTYLVDM
ncbi:MAG: hypothetical protein ACOCSL_00555 [Thermoplasmatota archaeon]